MSAIAVSPGAPRTGGRQLLGFNMLTGIILGIAGWFIGYSAIGKHIHGAGVAYYSTEAGQNDIAIMLGYLLGVVGFLVGVGFGDLERHQRQPDRRHPDRRHPDPYPDPHPDRRG